MKNEKRFFELLEDLKANYEGYNGNGIKVWILESMQDENNKDDAMATLESIAYSITGGVGGLIYYYETHEKFDTYYNEIQDAMEEFEGMTGEGLKIEGDLKNYLCWFAFEFYGQELLNEIEYKAEELEEEEEEENENE